MAGHPLKDNSKKVKEMLARPQHQHSLKLWWLWQKHG